MTEYEQLIELWEDDFGVDYTKRKLLTHEAESNLRRA
jgi:hypothetical protein